MTTVTVDIPTPDSFAARDFAFLNTKSAMDAIRNTRYFLPAPLHIKFSNPRPRDDYVLDTNDGSIIWEFTNNVAINPNFFTPWIVAHRAYHIIQGMCYNKTGKYYDVVHDIMMPSHTAFNRMMTFSNKLQISSKELIYGFDTPATNFGCNKVHEDIIDVFYKEATMRSAREHNMPRAIDMFAEWYAQYIVTGDIPMNTDVGDEFAAVLKGCFDKINILMVGNHFIF